MLPVIQSAISKNGISSSVYNETPDCDFILQYVGYQKWNLTTYLSKANIEIYQNNKLIGSASCHYPYNLSPSKWNSTQKKLEPLIDRMLAH
jgi:hypothetical protein